MPGVFVFGSNDYFAPTLRNPLRYLLPDDGQRNTHAPQLPWQRPARRVHRGRLARPDQHPRRRSRSGTRRSRSPASTTRTWATTGSTRSPAPPTRTPTSGSASRTRRTSGCSTSSPRDGYDAILAGHTHGGQVCLPGVGALTTNCDLEPARAKGLHRHPADSRPGRPGVGVAARVGRARHQPVRPDPRRLPPRGDPADAGAARLTGPVAHGTADFGGPSRARVCSPCLWAGPQVGPVIGLWRSLVARLVRDEEAAGSNPVSPTTGCSSRDISRARILSDPRPCAVSGTARGLAHCAAWPTTIAAATGRPWSCPRSASRRKRRREGSRGLRPGRRPSPSAPLLADDAADAAHLAAARRPPPPAPAPPPAAPPVTVTAARRRRSRVRAEAADAQPRRRRGSPLPVIGGRAAAVAHRPTRRADHRRADLGVACGCARSSGAPPSCGGPGSCCCS